jgi:Tannase and feruloyl esterase
MKTISQNPVRAFVAGCLIVSVVACGNDDDPTIPQLSAAVGKDFTGNCADLSASFSTLTNTTITASTTVAAGTLTVGGQPVAEHCQVTGKMFSRTSTVDGAAYAIGFEMRLPKVWNGRFYHQGNGGIDGAVVSALGGLGGGPVTNALQKGFAVLSSDAGHSGGTPAFGICLRALPATTYPRQRSQISPEPSYMRVWQPRLLWQGQQT